MADENETRSQDDEAKPMQPSPRAALVEALVMFGIATLGCSILWQLARVAGFIKRTQ